MKNDLPHEHVHCGHAHVPVYRLPRFNEAVKLAVSKRTAVVDLETSLKVAAPYLFQRGVVVATVEHWAF